MDSFYGEIGEAESVMPSTGRHPEKDPIVAKKFGSLPLSLHKVVPLSWIPHKY